MDHNFIIELREAFTLMDQNRDGIVNRADFVNCLSSLGTIFLK